MDLFFLFTVFGGLLAISSLYINSNTNAAYVAKKVSKYEGVIGIILVIGSLGMLVGTIYGFGGGAWYIIRNIFTLLGCLATLALGVIFFFKFFQPAPDAPAMTPVVPPAVPPAEGVPPALPVSAPPALPPSAGALASLKLPIGFAVLGFAALNFIFSFIRPSSARHPLENLANEFQRAFQ
jgi:hypothetical protein